MIIVELSKQQRTDAINSIQRYFEENLPDPIGELPASLLRISIFGRCTTVTSPRGATISSCYSFYR
jgi:hypothetical protein